MNMTNFLVKFNISNNCFGIVKARAFLNFIKTLEFIKFCGLSGHAVLHTSEISINLVWPLRPPIHFLTSHFYWRYVTYRFLRFQTVFGNVKFSRLFVIYSDMCALKTLLTFDISNTTSLDQNRLRKTFFDNDIAWNINVDTT